MARFPLVKGDWGGSPTTRKIGFSCSFRPFYPNCPPTNRSCLGNPVWISSTGSFGSNDFLSGSSTFHLILCLHLTFTRYVFSVFIRDNIFSTHAHFSEKLTFLTARYSHLGVCTTNEWSLRPRLVGFLTIGTHSYYIPRPNNTASFSI